MQVHQLDRYKVQEIRTLPGKPDEAAARALLERIAKQVQPIMRRRQFTVPVLLEFYPASPNLLVSSRRQCGLGWPPPAGEGAPPARRSRPRATQRLELEAPRPAPPRAGPQLRRRRRGHAGDQRAAAPPPRRGLLLRL